MVSIVSVQNKNFSVNWKELTEVPGANEETKSQLHWQFLGIWQSLRTPILESLYVNTSPFRTNGIAERAVRRIEQGTCAVLLQSGLDEQWRADSLECYCNLQNIQDLLTDGKTPYKRRFGEPFKGKIIPFGSMVEYHPVSTKDMSRLHQFGKKVLPGIFLGYALNAGESGKEAFRSRTLRSWKGWMHQKSTQKDFPGRGWKSKIIWRRSGPENIHLDTATEKNTKICQENQKCLHHHFKTHFRVQVKHERISLPFPETSFTAITCNQESNSTRRVKNNIQLLWNTLTLPGQHIRPWMYCRKAASTIIGISMVLEIYQIHGQVSHNLLYWMKTSRLIYIYIYI